MNRSPSTKFNLSELYSGYDFTKLFKIFPELRKLINKNTNPYSFSSKILVDKFSFYQMVLQKVKNYFELNETFLLSDSISIILKDIQNSQKMSNSKSRVELPFLRTSIGRNFYMNNTAKDTRVSKSRREYSSKSNGNKKKVNNINKILSQDEPEPDNMNLLLNKLDSKLSSPRKKMVHFDEQGQNLIKSKNQGKILKPKSNLKKVNSKKELDYSVSTISSKVIKCDISPIKKESPISLKILSNDINLDETHSRFYHHMEKNDKIISLFASKLNTLFNIDDKDFNIFEFNEAVGRENTLVLIGKYLFNNFNFEEIMEKEKYINWCLKIYEGYSKTNPYHTDLHAGDIAHTVYIYMTYIDEIKVLDKFSICALLLSSICHDYKHPGVNNNFLMETNDELALNYNDISILENMHISETFKLINSDKNCNIFSKMDKNLYKKIRKQMVACILTTDMANHKQNLDFLRGVENKQNIITQNDNQNFMNVLIHTADISNPTKKFDIYYKWAELVVEEFYQQGDKEKKLGLNCSCDREKVTIYKSQLGFIDYVESAYFEVFVKVFPEMKFLEENLKNNREKIKLMQNEDEKEKKNKI